MVLAVLVHTDGHLRRGSGEREFEVEGARRFDGGVAGVV